MNFLYAADFVMPFGKHKGKTIDEIGSTDDGLLYLDWLLGEKEGDEDTVEEALVAYLSDETIRHALEGILK